MRSAADAPNCNLSQEINSLHLMNISLLLHMLSAMHLRRSSSDTPRLPSSVEVLQNPGLFFGHFCQGDQSIALATRNDASTKSGPACSFFWYFWPGKCTSHQDGVRFFHITTSKSASKSAFSHLPRWLRTRHFSKPTCRPSGITNHWSKRNTLGNSTFSHLHLLSSDSFSFLIYKYNLSELLPPHSLSSPLQISVGTATPQLWAQDLSGHCQTSTASSRLQRAGTVGPEPDANKHVR